MLLVGHVLAIIAVFIAGYASRPLIKNAIKKIRKFRFKKSNSQSQNTMNRGGYSGTGMLPLYALFCTAIFALAPVIGLAWATLVFTTLGIATAGVAKYCFMERIDFAKPTSQQLSRFYAWRQKHTLSLSVRKLSTSFFEL